MSQEKASTREGEFAYSKGLEEDAGVVGAAYFF
jgi:hypothetical protein